MTRTSRAGLIVTAITLAAVGFYSLDKKSSSSRRESKHSIAVQKLDRVLTPEPEKVLSHSGEKSLDVTWPETPPLSEYQFAAISSPLKTLRRTYERSLELNDNDLRLSAILELEKLYVAAGSLPESPVQRKVER